MAGRGYVLLQSHQIRYGVNEQYTEDPLSTSDSFKYFAYL
jgi:hypothetical protein